MKKIIQILERHTEDGYEILGLTSYGEVYSLVENYNIAGDSRWEFLLESLPIE